MPPESLETVIKSIGNFGPEDETDDEEQTPQEYAREVGIAINHLDFQETLNEIECIQRNAPPLLLADEHLPQLNFSDLPELRERLQCNRGSAVILAKVDRDRMTAEEVELGISALLDVRKVRKLRVELPLLRTDHEADCRAWAMQPDLLHSHNLPEEVLNDELDEGMGWSAKHLDTPSRLLKEIGSEKIFVSTSAMANLAGYLDNEWTEDDENELWAFACPPRKKSAATIPLTPPLSPLLLATEPYIPSSSSAQIPFASDDESFLSDEIRKVEETIFQNDTFESHTQSMSSSEIVHCHERERPINHNSPSYYLTSPGNTSREEVRKLSSFKVEVPLMRASPSPTRENVSFNHEVTELRARQPSSDNTGSSAKSDDDTFFDIAMAEAFDIPRVEEAVRTLEHETLQEADATKRVRVPRLEFALPAPPWQDLQQAAGNTKHILELQSEFIRDCLEDFGFPPKSHISHALQASLRWAPTPKSSDKLVIEEVIGSEGELTDYLKDHLPGVILSSSDATWKPEGLAILRDDEEDEDESQDLQYGLFMSDQPLDTAALVKKRKASFAEEEEEEERADTVSPNSRSLLIGKRSRKFDTLQDVNFSKDCDVSASMETPEDNSLGHKAAETSILVGLGGFSVGNAIDNFIQMQGIKQPGLKESTYFGDEVTTGESKNTNLMQHQTLNNVVGKTPNQQDLNLSVPLPSVAITTMATPVIISTTVMKRRSLIKAITAQFPSLTLIERDFTSHNTLTWNQHRTSRSPIISPLASEADLIPSPSTGIILTTLQKVKQKPLPGQSKMTEIRRRIENVAYRYERLVVLISEASTTDTAIALDDTDCHSLTTFSAFCQSLATSASIMYIPGDDTALSKFLVPILAQESASAQRSGLPLLQDETPWEMFLRRAGMNAYAAQTVLGRLRGDDEVETNNASVSYSNRLARFVRMDARERIERFSSLLGGSRVLARVVEVLEQGWAV